MLLDHIEPTGFCWLWTGKVKGAYGHTDRTVAHRAVYEMLVGPIPKGLELDHLCRITLCVNPDHLEPVTRLENMRRRYLFVTACIHGHDYTPENTYITPSGYRNCKTCIRNAAAAYRERRAA